LTRFSVAKPANSGRLNTTPMLAARTFTRPVLVLVVVPLGLFVAL
jgi:hypothetical protein